MTMINDDLKQKKLSEIANALQSKHKNNQAYWPNFIEGKDLNSKGGWITMVYQKDHGEELSMRELNESESLQVEEVRRETSQLLRWFNARL